MRILSHNVYWFQGVPFDTDQPGAPNTDILGRLTACYAKIEPDVLCFQELQSVEAFDALKGALGMDGVYRAGGILTQYGGGVFYTDGAPFMDNSLAQVPAQRVWQIVEVQMDGESFKVGNVHLPSSRQLGQEAAALKRVAEIDEVLECKPDVVVGDWNELPGGPLTDRMTEAGYVDAAVAAGHGDVSSSIGDKRGDQIWILASHRDRLSGYGAVSVDDFAADGVEGKTHLSDHLPIWIDLGVDGAEV